MFKSITHIALFFALLACGVGCAAASGSEDPGASAPGATGGENTASTGGASTTGGQATQDTGGGLSTGGGQAVETGGAATGGDPSTGGAATGGTVSTGGVQQATGGQPAQTGGTGGTLVWTQTVTGTQPLSRTVDETLTGSIGLMTGAQPCIGIGSGPLPDDFTGTITIPIPADCYGVGIYQINNGGGFYYNQPTLTDNNYVTPAGTGTAFLGHTAILTVRKHAWHNNPSTYSWDYTWAMYY